jgi:hypothetical protein
MLTREKLYYVEPKVEEEEEEEDENIYGFHGNAIEKNPLEQYQDSAYELHYGEMWFHGRLKVSFYIQLNPFITHKSLPPKAFVKSEFSL